MRRALPLRGLARDQSGATIVEFAMLLPVMCILIMGVLDLGYRSYVTSIVQGSLHEAARMATVGGVTTAEIETHVRDRLRDFSHEAEIETETKSYSDFNGVNVPEAITQDTAPLGSYNAGDCYADANNNSTYDLDRGKGGLGGAEDVVHFEVRMTYPRIVPIGSFLGWSDDIEIVQNTVLRNQPFAGRNTGVTIRCS